MLKKTIPYIDLNGVERKEDFYFHLSKPEIVKMQTSVKGGYDVQRKSIGAGADGGQIMEFFEDLITKAYGVKSEDGRRFMKSEEISRSFMESPAYEILFEELVTNDKTAADFVNAVMNIGNSATAPAIAANTQN